MKVAFEAKIVDTAVYPVLDAVAELLGRIERHLFVDLCVRGYDPKELKRVYLKRFRITARMFNAIRVTLEGKVKAAREAGQRRVRSLGEKICSLEKSIAELEDRVKREQGPGSRQRLRFQIHHKRRRLGGLRARLRAAEEDLTRPVPRICFGSNRLFRRQFHLKENGYRSHAEWLRDWRCARSSQFLCLG